MSEPRKPHPFSLALLMLPLALLAALAACDTPPPRPSFPDIRFTDEAPFRLQVAAIDIRNNFQPSFREPEVDHLFPVPPARAAENWAQDRLKAGGSSGRARFVILDASVRETALPKTGGLEGAVTTEASERYDAVVEVRLDVLNDSGLVIRSASARVTRSQTVLEGITPNQRDQTWYDMTKALMAQLDQQLGAEIRGSFGDLMALR